MQIFKPHCVPVPLYIWQITPLLCHLGQCMPESDCKSDEVLRTVWRLREWSADHCRLLED